MWVRGGGEADMGGGKTGGESLTRGDPSSPIKRRGGLKGTGLVGWSKKTRKEKRMGSCSGQGWAGGGGRGGTRSTPSKGGSKTPEQSQ